MMEVTTATNIVDISFDHEVLDTIVDIFEVRVESKYVEACLLIRDHVSPISMARDMNQNVFYVMRCKSLPHPAEHDKISVRKVLSKTIRDILPRLCLRAIPHLTGETSKGDFDSKFMIPFPHPKANKDNGLLVCWSPEVYSVDSSGYKLDHPYLQIDLVSFTCLSAIGKTSRRDYLSKKHTHYRFGQEFLARAGGKKSEYDDVYVKVSPWGSKQRNTHPALDFDKDRLSSFMNSRSGFFLLVKDMMKEAWGDAVTFDYRRIKGTIRHIGSGQIDKRARERLLHASNVTRCYLGVDNEESITSWDKIAANLKKYTSIKIVDSVAEADLVLTPTKEAITLFDLNDPAQGRRLGSQVINVPLSMYNEKPLKNAQIKSMSEVILGELIVKKEVLSGRLHHPDHQSLPEFHAFYKNETNASYVHAHVSHGALSLEMRNQEYLENKYGALNTPHVIIIDDVKICISSTPIRGLPSIDHIREILSSMAGSGDPLMEIIPRADLLAAAAGADIDLSNLNPVTQHFSAQQICSMFPTAGKALGKNVVSTSLVANRALEKQLTSMGWMIRSGVRQKSKALFGSMDGIFVSDDRKIYMAGTIGNPKTGFERFPLARSVSATGEIPESFFSMLNDVTVRYKQSTVYPFIFKHMREYLELHGNMEEDSFSFLDHLE